MTITEANSVTVILHALAGGQAHHTDRVLEAAEYLAARASGPLLLTVRADTAGIIHTLDQLEVGEPT